jgi:integrase
MTTAKRWSHSEGKRGKNRVRVFEHWNGTLYIEFYDSESGGRAMPVRRSLGHNDRGEAIRQAKAAAERLAKGQAVVVQDPTLKTLFDNYVGEVSRRTKGPSKIAHDERTARMLTGFFGANRKASSLNIRDWDNFIVARRKGTIGPSSKRLRPVRDRQIEYDLKFLLAVLNWATKAQAGGEPLLERNPLRGLKLPKERNPLRPRISHEAYLGLLEAALSIDWRFEVALVLANETGHRLSAIRMLRWGDVDLEQRLIVWRAANDKAGIEHVTPLTDDAARVLSKARVQLATIGDGWVLPSPVKAGQPVSRHVLHKWLKKALETIRLGDTARIGYHCFRRKFASELMGLPLKELMALGGWRDPDTILTCYQQVDLESLRGALDGRSQSTQRTHSIDHRQPKSNLSGFGKY